MDPRRGPLTRVFSAVTEYNGGTPAQNARVSLAGLIADQIHERETGKRLRNYGRRHHDMIAATRAAMEELGSKKPTADVDVTALLDRRHGETLELLRPLEDKVFALRDRLFEAGGLEESEILTILGPYPGP